MYKSQIPRPKKHLKYFCHDHDESLPENYCKSDRCLVTPASFYKIEHDVPELKRVPGGRWRNFGLKMKAGDSMTVKDREEASNFYTSMKKIGIGVRVAKIDDGAYRVWRTS